MVRSWRAQLPECVHKLCARAPRSSVLLIMCASTCVLARATLIWLRGMSAARLDNAPSTTRGVQRQKTFHACSARTRSICEARVFGARPMAANPSLRCEYMQVLITQFDAQERQIHIVAKGFRHALERASKPPHDRRGSQPAIASYTPPSDTHCSVTAWARCQRFQFRLPKMAQVLRTRVCNHELNEVPVLGTKNGASFGDTLLSLIPPMIGFTI